MIDDIKRIFGNLVEEIQFSPTKDRVIVINNSILGEPRAISIDMKHLLENTEERLKGAAETLQDYIKYDLEQKLARQIQNPRPLDT